MNKKGFYNQGKIENRCRGNRYKSVLLNNMQYILGIKIGAVRLGSGTMTKMTNGEYVKEKVVADKRMYLFFDELPPHTRDFSRELGGFTCKNGKHMV